MDAPEPSHDPERQSDPGATDAARGVDWSDPVVRRLMVALVLCIVLAIACWVLGPRLGVVLPPIVPLVGFAVIAGGTLLGLWEARSPARGDDEPSDAGPG